MRLISTKRVVRGWWPVVRDADARLKAELQTRRGTAEIELLLVIPLLLTILFLAGGAMSLGKARMSNAYNAENDAYTQVVSGRGFSPSNDPVPPIGVAVPLLPTRYVMASEFQNVTINGKDVPAIVPTNDRAILLDAAWHYSAWPQSVDRPEIQAWFEAYVGESHPVDVVQALGLKAPGPP